MVTTYRYLIYSVLEAGKLTVDDSEINRATIAFWLQVEINRLRGERLGKRKIQSGEYLSHFGNISVLQDGMRKYVEMPQAIIDIQNDNGINQVTYRLEDFDYCDSPMDVPFEKTSPAKIWMLRAIPIRKPSPRRAFYGREGSKMYLYGIELVAVKYIEMWLYTAVDTKHLVSLDETIELAEDEISILQYRVLGLLKFALLMDIDKTNDGSGERDQRNKTALSQSTIGEQQSEQQQQTEQQ